MYDSNMKLWTEVRQAVLVDGLSETQTCQRFDIQSDTLKRILARLREEHGYPKFDSLLWKSRILKNFLFVYFAGAHSF